MTSSVPTDRQDPQFELVVDGKPIPLANMAELTQAAHVPPADTGIDPMLAEHQTSWEYLTDNINEFAVAKAIVDFLDANPKLLTDRNVPVDLLGLQMLAKVSLKRAAVNFAKSEQEKAQQEAAAAEAAKAMAKAREQSRGITSWPRRFGAHVAATVGALRANPNLMTIAVLTAWAFSSHISR